MTVYDNPILMLLAFVILAVAFFVMVKHFKVISVLALVVVAGGLAIFGVLYVGGGVLGVVMEHRAIEKCMTAHERQAKAYAAPDDYFGKQLREAAAEEAKTCAELAARKEAEEQAKK
jgi:type VI protein secretion system component VasK